VNAEGSWEWPSGCCTRPALDCRGSKSIRLDDNRLVYEGFCADVSFGGGYAIGSQSVNEFLENGPLDVQVPPSLVDDIRAHLSRPGP
jgi:hypothetical protein